MSGKKLGVQSAAQPAAAEQALDEGRRALVDEAYSRLVVFRDGCKEIHSKAKVARQIALLSDPNQDAPDTPRERKALQLPTLRSTLNNCIADQMDNMPEAMMLPETPQMQPVAEDVTDVVRFVLSRNDFEALHKRRVEDFFITGTAVTQVFWDEDMDHGQGNVGLLRWPIEAFLWDPVAEDIQDARALIKVSWHPLSWYAAHYPDTARFVGAEGYETRDVGVPDTWQMNQPGDEDRAMLMEYWYRRYDAKKRRYTVNVAYIAGGALLALTEDVYAHGLYPFILDVYERIEGLPAGIGMVHEFADMMRYVNRYYHYFDMNMRMASKLKILVNQNSGIDNDALTDFSKNIVEGQNVGDESVRPLVTPLFSGAATQVALQLQTDIKQDSGQNQFTRGETAGGVTAASAIAALQEAGGKITRMRTATLNQGFRRMAEQVVWLLSEFYTAARARMVTGKDGEMRPVDMSAAHLFGIEPKPDGVIPPPPYSVQVQVQRRNPMRVQAQNELFLQAFSMAAQSGINFPLTALFEMLNVDGKDTILPVLEEAEARTDMLMQAQQMIEQQQAQMEAQAQAIANMEAVLGGQEDVAGSGMVEDAAYAGTALPAAEVPPGVAV